MATVHRGGYDHRDMAGLAYGDSTRLMDRYMSSRLDSRDASEHYSSGFRDRAAKLYNRFKESRAYRGTLASARRMTNRGKPDAIRQLNTIGEFQNAPRIIQQYVMALPSLNKRFNRRQLAGYEDGYASRNPRRDAYRHTNNAYCVVMDGEAVKTDEGLEYVTYTNLNEEQRYALNAADKGDIIITWDNIERYLEHGIDDPSSTYNAALS